MFQIRVGNDSDGLNEIDVEVTATSSVTGKYYCA